MVMIVFIEATGMFLALGKFRLRVSYSIPCYGAGRTELVYSRSAPTRRSTGSKRRGGRRSLCRATSAIRRPAAEKTAPKQRRLKGPLEKSS